MTLPTAHQECDIRSWLDGNPGVASGYTAQRIQRSYPRMEDVLGRCAGLSFDSAFDIGCGAGLDSFAMGVHFDRVLAIDPNTTLIDEAGRIAQEAGVRNIRFGTAKAEYFSPDELFSFAFCNIMSHNVDSRCMLAVRIAMALKPGGWLHYAEAQEGYAPCEMHRAIQRRDGNALAERLRQLLRGFLKTTGFRFFVSDTISPLFASLGLRNESLSTSVWNGIPYQQTLLAVRDGALDNPPDGRDMDYLRVPEQFSAIRKVFAEYAAGRPPEGLTQIAQQTLETRARSDENPWAPYLYLLSIADRVLPSLDPIQNGDPNLDDWTAIEELDRKFITLMRERAGLHSGKIDD